MVLFWILAGVPGAFILSPSYDYVARSCTVQPALV